MIFLDKKENKGARFNQTLVEGVEQRVVHFSQNENWYHAFGRIRKKLPADDGIIVSNDAYDLIMLQQFNTGKKVVQLVHDAYNIRLAMQYHDVVDAFVCHSYFYYEVLCQLLSGRRNDIYHLPYGIPVLNITMVENRSDALKCLFLGRLNRQKGIYDLFEIDALLQKRSVLVNWTIAGRGDELQTLKTQWKDKRNVQFISPGDYEELIQVCAANDCMVFPTKFEGFPVALVETMSVGCVPIVTDLPGGIREVVNSETGFLCTLNDNEQFAKALIDLNVHRNKLERLSTNCRMLITNNYNAVVQSPLYQQLFRKVFESDGEPKHHAVRKKIGSRLDKRWIPNKVTKIIRKA